MVVDCHNKTAPLRKTEYPWYGPPTFETVALMQALRFVSEATYALLVPTLSARAWRPCVHARGTYG